MKNEITIFEDQSIKLEVSLKDDTVWLTQKQMSILFEKDENTINEHINNVFSEGELDKNSSTGISGNTKNGRPPKIYNLDVIISVGYRVKSKNGILFRKWATNILKEYMLKGYAINQKRLEYFDKTIKIIELASRTNDNLEDNESKQILNVISKYTNALNLLDDYDHNTILKRKGLNTDKEISYEDCIKVIKQLSFNEHSNIFGLERDMGLKSIISNIYQTFDGKDVYSSIEEKASNFLYMIIKNHVFIDGNKRIAATLFIYILNFYNILYKDNKQIIDNNSLVAITLLIAESNPKEKCLIVDLVTNFLF
jgi:prophage maintenance system killer protein